MKRILAITILLIITFSAFGSRAPFFNRETIERFEALEVQANNEIQMMKLPHNFAIIPKIAGSSQALGGVVPAGSHIIGVSVIIKTLVVSVNNNTASLKCIATGDLDVAFVPTASAVNDALPGAPRVNDETTWLFTPTACIPTIEIGAGASGITGGELVYVVRYLQADPQL